MCDFHFDISDLIFSYKKIYQPLQKSPLITIHIIIHISCCCSGKLAQMKIPHLYDALVGLMRWIETEHTAV